MTTPTLVCFELENDNHTEIYQDQFGNLFTEHCGDYYAWQPPEIGYCALDRTHSVHKFKPRIDFQLQQGSKGSCWFEPVRYDFSTSVLRADVTFYLDVQGVVWNSKLSMPVGNTLYAWLGSSPRYGSLLYLEALEHIFGYFAHFAERAAYRWTSDTHKPIGYSDGEYASYLGSEISDLLAIIKEIQPEWLMADLKQRGWLG